MFHKNASNSQPNVFSEPNPATQSNSGPKLVTTSALIPAARREEAVRRQSSLIDLAVITSRRCSSFFAEAAVLVLVFGILDFFILKGRIDLSWIVGALAISLALLTASIAMDWSAHRWIKAHP